MEHDPVRARFGLLASPATVLTVAALVRVLVWAPGVARPDSFVGGDTPGYWALAADPVSTYAATEGPFYELGLRRPPAYPALLALFRAFTEEVAGAALLQALLGVATVAGLLALARRAVGPREAVVGGWWLALDPLHAVESSVLLTEIPFSLTVLVAAFAAWKASRVPETGPLWWAAAGGALGIATLIRPISLYLAPFAALVVVVAAPRAIGPRASLTGAATLLFAFSLPTGAWIARNHNVSGVPTVSTIQGLNLARYRAPGSLLEGRRIPMAEARRRVDAMVESRVPAGANPAERAKVQERVGIEVILSEPLGYAIAAGKGLARTLFGPGGARIEARMAGLPGGGTWGYALTLLSGVSAVAGSLLMLGGLAVLARRRSWLVFLLLGVPLFYLLLVGSGPEAYSRFRLQMLPFILIAAATAVVSALDRFRARKDPHLDPEAPLPGC